jgi:nicotinamide mononucleotide adenylyltransferase
MNSVTFTFGRFNPPTRGHLRVIEEMKKISEELDCPYRIFTSQKNDNTRNPLSYDRKFHYAKKILGEDLVNNSSIISIFDVIKSLEEDGYRDLVMVVGSDRKKIFENKLMHYVGNEFDIDSLKLISAGERIENGTGLESISSSKMREYAKNNNFEDFRVGLPENIHIKDMKSLFREVQEGLLYERNSSTKLV